MKTYTQEQEIKCEQRLVRIAICLAVAFIFAVASFAVTPTINGHTLNIFENKAWDRSGNGNDGIASSSKPILNNGNTVFSGSEMYLVSGLDEMSNFTFLIWCYPTKVYKKIYGGSGHVIQVGYTANNVIRLSVSSGNHIFNVVDSVIDATNVIAFVYGGNSTHNFDFYNNGIEYNVATGVTGYFNSCTGTVGGQNIPNYEGIIFDFRIYNRTITSNEYTIYQSYCDAGLTMPVDAISTNGLVLFYDFDIPERTLAIQEPTYYYDDLAAWYPLNGNANDYSKNDNDGTVYGAVSTGTNYWFDGVNDYITADSTIEYPFTLSAWVNAIDIDSTFISVANSSDTKYFAILFKTDGFYARVYDGVSTKDAKLNVSYAGWHFVVGVFSSSTSRQIYVDGVAGIENTAIANAIPINTATIGVTADSTPVNHLKGYIKDVRIYDQALTAEEILTIYNSTK